MLPDWLWKAETWLPGQLHWLALAWLLIIAVLLGFELLIPAFARTPERSQRWPTNCGMGVVNGVLAVLLPVSIIAGAEWASARGWGLFNQIAMPTWLVVLASVAVRSLAAYLLHVAFHKVPMLWRLHRVHHLDQHVDVTTSLRSHPVEFVATLITLTGVAIVVGLNPWAIAGYEIAEAALNLASHANLRLPDRMDKIARWVLVTPNMHCLHHSSLRSETDSNYGVVISWWDRLFRTYRTKAIEDCDGMQFGLAEVRDQRAARFWWQMKSPLLTLDTPPPRAADVCKPSPTSERY